MNLEQFIESLNSGKRVDGDSPELAYMRQMSHLAMRTTCQLNYQYHTPEEIRALFSELIGKPVGEDFNLFPPF